MTCSVASKDMTLSLYHTCCSQINVSTTASVVLNRSSEAPENIVSGAFYVDDPNRA